MCSCKRPGTVTDGFTEGLKVSVLCSAKRFCFSSSSYTHTKSPARQSALRTVACSFRRVIGKTGRLGAQDISLTFRSRLCAASPRLSSSTDRPCRCFDDLLICGLKVQLSSAARSSACLYACVSRCVASACTANSRTHLSLNLDIGYIMAWQSHCEKVWEHRMAPEHGLESCRPDVRRQASSFSWTSAQQWPDRQHPDAITC